jgi:predicted DCC family thiol-disulfide oxidoreductase YuxK
MKERSPLDASSTDLPIVFFDGVCNLCNGYVDFMLRHDRKGRFLFAALQGRVARARLGDNLPTSGELASIVLLDEQGLHAKSEAVLRALMGMGGAWRLLRPLLFLPPGLRDTLYDFVATHRYRWFGRRETCRLPRASERRRFLD